MIVELHGLEVFGYHGAYPEEQRDGQPFWFDVELEVGDRGADDRLADAIDYTEVAAPISRALLSTRVCWLRSGSTAARLTTSMPIRMCSMIISCHNLRALRMSFARGE